MSLGVLVVDDSRFFRRRVTEILDADPRLHVIGAAGDGAEAIKKVQELHPDVITMDIEMPVMDGITAVRRIMAVRPTPIIMFSSLTTEGAKSTLDALDAGALDFLPKRFEDIARDRGDAKQSLCDRVVAIARRATRPATVKPPVTKQPAARRPEPAAPVMPRTTLPVSKPTRAVGREHFKLLAIGTSTGGPIALQQVLKKLPQNFPLPILLIQHMPGTFTPAFAQRLNQCCDITVKEAQNGDVLRPGTAYLAPGGFQMLLQGRAAEAAIRIKDSEPGQNYRPSVDVTFNSANQVFPGKILAIVLTGMGADGREGARSIKQSHSEVWAQDEATSVVYGMPSAIVEAGLADHVYSLNDIGERIVQKVM
jgi:two-component system chemotaxis response regulator CheB